MRHGLAASLIIALLVGSSRKSQAAVSFTDPRFEAQVFASSIYAPRDIAFGPGSVFGDDLYVVSNNVTGASGTGSIVTIGPDGSATTWAGTMNGPYGMSFSVGGSFGSYLYVNTEDHPDGVFRIDPMTRSISSQLAYVDEGTEIHVSPGGGFGDFMYAAQARVAGLVNYVYKVDDSFAMTPFATFGENACIRGMTFSPGGSFGEYLYVVGQLDPAEEEARDLYVNCVDVQGNVSIFSDEPMGPYRGFLAFSPGDPWGDFLYVTAGPNLYRVKPNGEASLFAAGFDVATGLAFSPDGSTLYVAQTGYSRNILAIVPEPATLSVLALGWMVLVRRPRGRRDKSSTLRHTSRRGEAAFMRWRARL